jgi:hypothetical protein
MAGPFIRKRAFLRPVHALLTGSLAVDEVFLRSAAIKTISKTISTESALVPTLQLSMEVTVDITRLMNRAAVIENSSRPKSTTTPLWHALRK